MPRARSPVAKAKATAADVKNPQRHKKRAAPKGPLELGSPPKWMSALEAKAFNAFKGELPWLKESHRVLVELAAGYRARMMDPDPLQRLGLQAAQELRRCLAQLGATPADESKVTLPDGGEEDPEAAHFRPPPTSH